MWEYFLVLHNTRSSGMGINGISYTEIQSWANMTKTDIQPGEVEIIKRLDSVFMTHYHKTTAKKK